MAEKEYIERGALALKVRRYLMPNVDIDGTVSVEDAVRYFLKLLDEQPTADVVEVVHGEWKSGYQNGQYGIWCTRCRAGWVDSENAEWIAHEHDYCPKCGAKMDGGIKNG